MQVETHLIYNGLGWGVTETVPNMMKTTCQT